MSRQAFGREVQLTGLNHNKSELIQPICTGLSFFFSIFKMKRHKEEMGVDIVLSSDWE